jgi:hypothetical protein
MDLPGYQAPVGGNIEVVRLYRPAASMYVNEEGKLEGLPMNHRATALASVHNDGFRGQDVVVGDVLVTGPVGAEGYDRSVPAKYIELWFAATRFRVQKQLSGSRGWRVKRASVYDDVFTAYVAAVRLALREPEVTAVRVVGVG